MTRLSVQQLGRLADSRRAMTGMDLEQLRVYFRQQQVAQAQENAAIMRAIAARLPRARSREVQAQTAKEGLTVSSGGPSTTSTRCGGLSGCDHDGTD